MDLSRYAELFLTESQEHLQSINEALLELERSGHDPDAVDRFFRSVHTIKGMSATMGYSGVAQLSHDMESLLSEVRDGSRGLDGDLLDVLFQATDTLENAVAESAAGRDAELNLTDILAVLAIAKGGAVAASADRRKNRRATGSAPAVSSEPDALRVDVRIRKDAALPAVRALLVLARLKSLGEVLASQPSKQELEGDAFDGTLVVFMRSQIDPAVLSDAVKAAGDVESVRVGSAGNVAQVQGVAEQAAAAGQTPGAVGENAERRGVRHVRVEQRRLDALMNLVGELVISRGRLVQRSLELEDDTLDEVLGAASRQIAEMQDEIMAIRMVPVWQVFDRFPRLVRDAAKSLGRKVDFVLEGRDIELDRSLLDEIGDPIVHLLRNAVDHGLESPEERLAVGKGEEGRLVLSASRDREAVLVSVADDGRGIDRKKIAAKARDMGLISGDVSELTDEMLFTVISTSGFSTAAAVTDISGRGVGVDAVVSKVRSLGGTLEMRTALGEGTRVTIRLPLTLAIIKAMLATVGKETYALPLTHIAETVEVDPAGFRTVRGQPVTVLRGEVLPLFRLGELVHLPAARGGEAQMVVLEVAAKRAGLLVDELVGQQEIVVKQFDAARSGLQMFSGATILGNGEPALIVDVGSII